jgi:hypothetical protein
MNSQNFMVFLNGENNDFYKYNKESLYILKGGNFLDMKNLFSIVNRDQTNIGRGSSQKSHALSPLELRLTSYLMAMVKFNFDLISKLNLFDDMGKDRYLSYKSNIFRFNHKNNKN